MIQALLVLTLASFALAADAAPRVPTPTELLDWAERAYPDLLPGKAANQSLTPYIYRHYPSTGNYTGVAGSDIYIMGPISGGQLTKVGVLSDFACLVFPAECGLLETRSKRLDGHGSSGMAVRADGSVVSWGYGSGIASEYIPGTTIKIIAGVSGAASVAAPISGPTLVVTRGGQLIGWGSNPTAIGVTDPSLPGFVEDARHLPQLTNVVEARTCQYASFSLRNDGTVWMLPGVQVKGQPIQAAKVEGLKSITSLAYAHYEGGVNGCRLISLDSDGRVWNTHAREGAYDSKTKTQLWTSSTTQFFLPPTNIKQISCDRFRSDADSACIALTKDGKVYVWDVFQQSPAPKSVAVPSGYTIIDVRKDWSGWGLASNGRVVRWDFTNGDVPAYSPYVVPGMTSAVELSRATGSLVVDKAGDVWFLGGSDKFEKLVGLNLNP